MRRTKLIITAASCIAILAVAAGIARWTELRAQESQRYCVNLLRQLDGAKQQWALETKASPDAEPTWDHIRNYFKSAAPPSWAHCPSGGTYTLGRIRELPSCSIDKHQHAFESIIGTANHPAAGNAGISSRLAIEHHWTGVPDPER
jgi:hypothetical protein